MNSNGGPCPCCGVVTYFLGAIDSILWCMLAGGRD